MGKSMETESRFVVARGWGEDGVGVTANGFGVWMGVLMKKFC